MKVILFLILTISSAYAKNDVPLQNIYKSPDGTYWSDELPQTHINCILKKEYEGKPAADLERVRMTAGEVICERDTQGRLLGLSGDGKTIVDSDAVRSCKALGAGWDLPSVEDFIKLGAGASYLHHSSPVYKKFKIEWVWTSSTMAGYSRPSEYIVRVMILHPKNFGGTAHLPENSANVFCVKHP